jgi:hypothetical protein
MSQDAFEARADSSAIRTLLNENDDEITVEHLAFVILRHEVMKSHHRKGTQALIAVADTARASLAQALVSEQLQAAQAQAAAAAVQAAQLATLQAAQAAAAGT